MILFEFFPIDILPSKVRTNPVICLCTLLVARTVFSSFIFNFGDFDFAIILRNIPSTELRYPVLSAENVRSSAYLVYLTLCRATELLISSSKSYINMLLRIGDDGAPIDRRKILPPAGRRNSSRPERTASILSMTPRRSQYESQANSVIDGKNSLKSYLRIGPLPA